MNRNNNGSRN